MLVAGQFIHEGPVKIGAHYVPMHKSLPSAEEEFFQEVILYSDDKLNGMSGGTSLPSVPLLLIIFFGLVIFVPILKLAVQYFIG